jgi:hypothetical protein
VGTSEATDLAKNVGQAAKGGAAYTVLLSAVNFAFYNIFSLSILNLFSKSLNILFISNKFLFSISLS